jgi:hypothetical protein
MLRALDAPSACDGVSSNGSNFLGFLERPPFVAQSPAFQPLNGGFGFN